MASNLHSRQAIMTLLWTSFEVPSAGEGVHFRVITSIITEIAPATDLGERIIERWLNLVQLKLSFKWWLYNLRFWFGLLLRRFGALFLLLFRIYRGIVRNHGMVGSVSNVLSVSVYYFGNGGVGLNRHILLCWLYRLRYWARHIVGLVDLFVFSYSLLYY